MEQWGYSKLEAQLFSIMNELTEEEKTTIVKGWQQIDRALSKLADRERK